MRIRDFKTGDADAVNALALAAFQQYEGRYDDWPAFRRDVGAMSTLAERGELIVAELCDRIVGAVVYAGPDVPKPTQFEPKWPIIRMLAVDPAARGHGIGRALTLECIGRAERDGCGLIALHTSPFMVVAVEMYLRMGFAAHKQGPAVRGATTQVYVKHLAPRAA